MKKPAKKVIVKRGINGLGLYALVPFKKREQVIEYVGEIISVDEADRRGGRYLFELNKKKTIDGKSRTNIARYINHACIPNCETEINGLQVFVYTLRPIAPGEELTYDYGREYFDEYIKPKGCRCASCTLKKK